MVQHIKFLSLSVFSQYFNTSRYLKYLFFFIKVKYNYFIETKLYNFCQEKALQILQNIVLKKLIQKYSVLTNSTIKLSHIHK